MASPDATGPAGRHTPPRGAAGPLPRTAARLHAERVAWGREYAAVGIAWRRQREAKEAK